MLAEGRRKCVADGARDWGSPSFGEIWERILFHWCCRVNKRFNLGDQIGEKDHLDCFSCDYVKKVSSGEARTS